MKLIVGLGNPGRKYAKTRHNIGWMVGEQVIKNLEAEPARKIPEFKALVTEARIGREKVIIAMPTTYMNLSGEAVQKIMQFYKIKPVDLIVVYDDLDFRLGQLKIRASGSAGTHNGMKSIVTTLGTTEFVRVRIGIESRGELAPKQQATDSFVLSEFLAEELELAKSVIDNAAAALVMIIEDSLSAAMNQYNGGG